MLILKNF